jgi:hypothetical protein
MAVDGSLGASVALRLGAGKRSAGDPWHLRLVTSITGFGVAVLSGSAPLPEPAHDRHAAALAAGVGGVPGLAAPDDHG